MFQFQKLEKQITCIEDKAPEARPDSLPATFVTPCRTLSLTSSMSGVWRPRPAAGVSCRPKYSAEDMEAEPWNRLKLASGPAWKK